MAPGGPSARRRLAELGRLADDELALAETALLLAAPERTGAAEDGLARLAEWGAALAGAAEQAEVRAARLAELLAAELGFRLDDEPEGASLSWVLQHRGGSPEALGIVWLETARRAGWKAEGLTFPGHFLIRLQDEGGRRVIVDPASGGVPVDPPGLRALCKAAGGLAAELDPALFVPLSNREILVRLQNEVKLRLLRDGQVAQALAVVETVLLFAPDRVLWWREAGLMHMRLGDLAGAVAALEQFVARTGNGAARRRTQQLLQEIRARMN